jgi:hypothetical protein
MWSGKRADCSPGSFRLQSVTIIGGTRNKDDVADGSPRRRAHHGLAGLAGIPGVGFGARVEHAANVAARLAVLEAVRAAVHVTDESSATLGIHRALRLRQGGGGLTLVVGTCRWSEGEHAHDREESAENRLPSDRLPRGNLPLGASPGHSGHLAASGHSFPPLLCWVVCFTIASHAMFPWHCAMDGGGRAVVPPSLMSPLIRLGQDRLRDVQRQFGCQRCRINRSLRR